MTELIALGFGGFLGFVVVFLAWSLQGFLWVSRPNEVLIFSGRSRTLSDGSRVGYRIVHGGYSLQVPVLEKVARMSLETIPIDVHISNAYSKGGIPLEVFAIANVKVSSDPIRLANAIERFQGRDTEEIRRVAKESLEGHIRGVVARMTPEEVNEDRLKFAKEMIEEAGEDFNRLGLQLDTLKIQSVMDSVQYLDSIGRQRLAEVISTAEIAESQAKADAEMAEAEAKRRGQVAIEQANTQITTSRNELARRTAEWEARAKGAEERAEQSALAARARAEQRLQELRARLEGLRLQAERVLPAEASRTASEMKARADASQIVADGEAMAEVLRMMTETWLKAGNDARDVFLVQQLEGVLQTIVNKVKGLEIGEVVLLDGGDGRALPDHVASMPAIVGSVLAEFARTTGLDIPSILARRPDGPVQVTLANPEEAP
jgi:flotillin